MIRTIQASPKKALEVLYPTSPEALEKCLEINDPILQLQNRNPGFLLLYCK
jgi:hypothetical protein